MTTARESLTAISTVGAAGRLRPALYLIPSTMSDAAVSSVIPAGNIELIRGIKDFVVENVRTVRRFLKRCDRNIDIDSLSFTVLDEHTDPADVPAMLDPIYRGAPVGVISEAGCPAIADPGADLVGVAQAKGIEVIPLVGPSSILLSLMGSGFNGQSFAFLGYLPHDAKARSAKLKEMERRIRTEQQTQIFIETPYRNNKMIKELCAALPRGMRLCVASDLTGPSEKIVTRTLAAWTSASYDYDKTPAIFLLYS